MSETAILLNIGDMIDLAIGTPEVGVVDFNMLQTVLHCLAQQLRILGKNVELRGSIASIPTSRENTQTIDIREYAVDLSDEIPTKKDELAPPPPTDETILVVERVRRPDSPDREFPIVYAPSSEKPRASPSVSKKAPTSTDTSQKGSRPTDPSFVTYSKFNLLEKAVEEIKSRGPLEKAVHKLEKAVDEMKAHRHSDTQSKPPSTQPQPTESTGKFKQLEQTIDQLEKAIDDMKAHRPSDSQSFVTQNTFKVLENSIVLLEHAVDDLRAQKIDTQSQANDKQPIVTPSNISTLEKAVGMLEKAVDEIRGQRPSKIQSEPIDLRAFVTLSKFNVLEKAVDEMRAHRSTEPQSRPTDTQPRPTEAQSRSTEAQNLVTLSKFNVLEKAVDEIRARLPTGAQLITIPQDKLTVLQKSVEVLEIAINEIKDNRPDDSTDIKTLTGKCDVLERAVEILENAVEQIRSDQPTDEPQKSLVTLSKFKLLEKAVDVLEKTIGEVKAKPAETQPVDDSRGLQQTLSLVTLSKFNLLKQTVEDIKERVFSSIPKNESLLEEVRSQTNIKAIQDMWQSLNVQSRLEAAELGLGKLSSLVEDLISESADLKDAIEKRGKKKQESAPAALPSSQGVPPPVPTRATSPAPSLPRERSPVPPPGATKEDLAAIKAHLQGLQADVDTLMGNFLALIEDMNNDTEAETQLQPGAEPGEPAESPPSGTGASGTTATQDKARRLSALAQGLGDRVNNVEKRMVECCDTIGKVEGVVQDQLNSFQDQLEYLLKQVGGISTELSSGKLSPDLVKDLQGLMALFQTVQDMQVQLQKVHDTALQLASEKDDRQQYLNSLLEQIDLLKTVKLDREDMAEAMADKADVGMLARKVSHDRFETACDDLSKGLEHALGKLNLQEALWQQALDDIQREIETKLDKMELSPVKDFFNSKLKTLQENLKQMSSLRKEAEAAGTKRRLLRDVNCISCDAKAVMQMDVANNLPITKPLPANLSMKPYLSYELDTIRKSQLAQGQMPGTRNMHDWENIDRVLTPAKPPPKVRSEADKHLCNRYCGGSHTMTTPSQRVARLGHFIKQWGPDVLPLSSGMAAGDDGRMYRVTAGEKGHAGPGGPPPEPANTPRPPKKPETPKPADSRPKSGIPPECRCLENAGTPLTLSKWFDQRDSNSGILQRPLVAES